MGIRAYKGDYPPKEYNASLNYDLFHNVAFYWDWLQDVMIHYTPCEAATQWKILGKKLMVVFEKGGNNYKDCGLNMQTYLYKKKKVKIKGC